MKKAANFVGITFLAMTITVSCNQSSTNNEKSNNQIPQEEQDQIHQIPQEEQDQIPGQSKQNSVPFQQPSTATEVSDKELKQFALAVQQVEIIKQEVQQEMLNTIEEKGLDLQRFNEIQKAQQNPLQDIDATSEELGKYESASGELLKMQGQAQQKMQEKIIEVGLPLSRYEEIAMALQSDTGLQEKFQIIQNQNN